MIVGDEPFDDAATIGSLPRITVRAVTTWSFRCRNASINIGEPEPRTTTSARTRTGAPDAKCHLALRDTLPH